MKRLLILLFLLPTAGALAQTESLYLGSQRQPVRVTASAVYQRYTEGDLSISQVSFPVSGFFPLGRSLALSLLASHASATGRDLEAISDVTDAQVALSYLRHIGSSSLVASLSTNVPSGREQLTLEEYRTSVLLSQNHYNFRVPVFGQGVNVAPSLTWALPLSERFVLGIGGAYQYRGSFRPTDALQDSYDPGDEILLTGGLDFRLGDRTSVASDVTYTLYAADRLGEDEVYTAGNKLVLTGQFRQEFGSNRLHLLARYRTRANNQLPYADALGQGALRTVPDQVELRGFYSSPFSEGTLVTWVAQMRHFGALESVPSRLLVDLGAVPRIAVSRNVTLRTQALYTVGDINGIEVGFGLEVEL